jgi:hypothetical protein
MVLYLLLQYAEVYVCSIGQRDEKGTKSSDGLTAANYFIINENGIDCRYINAVCSTDTYGSGCFPPNKDISRLRFDQE